MAQGQKEITVTRKISDILRSNEHTGTIVRNMPREAYNAVSAMNVSTVKPGLVGSKDIDTTMIRDVYEGHRRDPSRAQQDSFDRGTLAHLILLQPEMIPGRVAVWKGGRRVGNEWDAFERENAGKLIMKEADVRDVQAACRSFREVKEVNDLFRPCDTELSVFWQEGDVYCKGMLDAVTRQGECVVIDPKTIITGIDERSVRRQIEKFHYREQLGFYKRGYENVTGRIVDKVYLVFISLPPQRLGVRLEPITDAALEWGADRVLKAIKQVRHCIETDEWPVFFASGVCDLSSNEEIEIEVEDDDDE